MVEMEQPKTEKALEKITKMEEQLKAKEEAKAAPTAASGVEGAKPKPAETKAEKKKEEKAAKAEAKKEEKKEPKKREIVLERTYVANLSKAYEKPAMFRAIKSVKMLRAFVARHMKTTEDKVRIEPTLSEALKARGHKHPLKKVKLIASKDKEGIAVAKLA